MQLSSLHVYPIKSCRGVTVPAWEVDRFGLRLDRRWMVVDQQGLFLTQRKHPVMATIRVGLEPDALEMSAPGMADLRVEREPGGGDAVQVRVWEDFVDAWAPDPHADHWFSDYMGTSLRLAYMPEHVVRPVSTYWSPAGGRTSFADAFPFLLIGTASLRDLNSRLEKPLPMNRFRPNLVVETLEPFAEDSWRHIQIADIPFDVVKPCSRCVLPTTDQETGERGQEPIRTLARYRLRDGSVYFGQNLVHRKTGTLTNGDLVEILDAR